MYHPIDKEIGCMVRRFEILTYSLRELLFECKRINRCNKTYFYQDESCRLRISDLLKELNGYAESELVPYAKELDTLIRQVDKAREERNKIIHSLYLYLDNKTSTYMKNYERPKRKNTARNPLKVLKLETGKIKPLVVSMSLLDQDIRRLTMEIKKPSPTKKILLFCCEPRFTVPGVGSEVKGTPSS